MDIRPGSLGINTGRLLFLTETNCQCSPVFSPAPFTIDGQTWDVTDDDLGGYFYDHICNESGKILGLRYWLDPDESFGKHNIFSRFSSDVRFHFDEMKGLVDFLFEREDIQAYKDNLCRIDTVQDFGGITAARSNDKFGILIRL